MHKIMQAGRGNPVTCSETWTRTGPRRVLALALSLLLAFVIGAGASERADAATSLEQGAATWASNKGGSTSYRYLCLKFVYDAWIGAGMSRATLDAKSGYVSTSNSYPIDQWNYWMAGHSPSGTLHIGADPSPPIGAIIYFSNRLGHDYSHATISLGGGNQVSPDTDRVNGPQSVTTNNYRTMLGWWLPDVDPGPAAISPVGALDSVQSETPGQLHVSGWARDDNDPGAALSVHIYIGGPAGTPGLVPVVVNAGVSRSDVGAHGYDVSITTPSTVIPIGTFQVCSYAINIGPFSPNPELGCRSVTVASPDPSGTVGGIVGGGSDPHVLIYGSASDPNDPSAQVSISAWIDGHPGDAGATSIDLGSTGTYLGGRDHTFSKVIGLSVGTHLVCVSAVNVGPGVDHELGCANVAITPPTVPDAPTNLSATAGNASAQVTWTDHAVGAPTTSASIKASPGGKTWTIPGAGTTATLTGLSNGTAYTFTVTLTNAIGTGATSVASNSVTPKAPVGTCAAPRSASLTLVTGTALSSGTNPTIPVRAGWTGSSGCSYVLEKQVGTTWSSIYSGSGTSFRLPVAFGTSVPTLRVVAINTAGVRSISTAMPSRGLDSQQDTQFTYPNGKYASTGVSFWAGNATMLTSSGARAQASVLADQLAIVAGTGPYYGAFDVYIDGALKGTVDTYSSSEKSRQVVAAYSLTRAPHTVEIVAKGTAGRPAVLLDGIASLW